MNFKILCYCKNVLFKLCFYFDQIKLIMMNKCVDDRREFVYFDLFIYLKFNFLFIIYLFIYFGMFSLFVY